ncbi:MAG: hypothetical protein ABI681_06840 [Gemmatimonadales bacterium]
MGKMSCAAFALTACTATETAEKSEKAPPGNQVEIIGTDYAFQAPASLPAGRTLFRFANHGKARHELNISLLRPGVSIDTFIETIRTDQTVQPLIEGPVGVLFAEPGGQSASGLAVDLRKGQTYAVICIFRDSTGARRHYDLGMYSTISVGNARPIAPLPQLATDTIVATDYAFRYARMVRPGRHTFLMKNEGKVRHELNFMLLKKGVTLEHVREVEKSGASVDSLFDGDLGLLHGRAGQTPLGQLTIDMLPDREYAIACFFKDDDKSPEHYVLGMFGSIRTAGMAQYDSTWERQQARMERMIRESN